MTNQERKLEKDRELIEEYPDASLYIEETWFNGEIYTVRLYDTKEFISLDEFRTFHEANRQ